MFVADSPAASFPSNVCESHKSIAEGHDQHRALGDVHEHIGKVDEILSELPDDLGGRKGNVRAMLRTIGRFLDEAGPPSIHRAHLFSDERTNRELRAVLFTVDIPTDRRAFDINTDVQARKPHARQRRGTFRRFSRPVAASRRRVKRLRSSASPSGRRPARHRPGIHGIRGLARYTPDRESGRSSLVEPP